MSRPYSPGYLVIRFMVTRGGVSLWIILMYLPFWRGLELGSGQASSRVLVGVDGGGAGRS